MKPVGKSENMRSYAGLNYTTTVCFLQLSAITSRPLYHTCQSLGYDRVQLLLSLLGDCPQVYSVIFGSGRISLACWGNYQDSHRPLCRVVDRANLGCWYPSTTDTHIPSLRDSHSVYGWTLRPGYSNQTPTPSIPPSAFSLDHLERRVNIRNGVRDNTKTGRKSIFAENVA